MTTDTEPKRSDAYGRCLLCRTMVFVGEVHECLVEARVREIAREEVKEALFPLMRISSDGTVDFVCDLHSPEKAPLDGCNCEVCEEMRTRALKPRSGE